MTRPPEESNEEAPATVHPGNPPRAGAELSDAELEPVSGGMSHEIVVTPAPPSPVPLPYPNVSKP